MTQSEAIPTLTATDPAESPDDVAAIHAVIADVERAVNTKDVALGVAHFAEGAVVINAAGAEVRGRHAIERAHVAAFAGILRDSYARYEVGPITFVRPDVAVVTKEARAIDADGTLLGGAVAMRAVYTLVREGGRWWIAARGNTVVPSE